MNVQKVNTTMAVLKNKEESASVKDYTVRSCQLLAKLPIGDKTYLMTDSTYSIDVIDPSQKKLVAQIDLAGGLLRCSLVLNNVIILGIEDPKMNTGHGNIIAYDNESFLKIGDEKTEALVTPLCIQSYGESQFVVGMSNGCL